MDTTKRARPKQSIDIIENYNSESPMNKLIHIMVKLHKKSSIEWPLTNQFWQTVLSSIDGNQFCYKIINENVQNEDERDELNLFCWAGLNRILIEKAVELALDKLAGDGY